MAEAASERALRTLRTATTERLLDASAKRTEKLLGDQPDGQTLDVAKYLADAIVALSLQQELIHRLSARIDELERRAQPSADT